MRYIILLLCMMSTAHAQDVKEVSDAVPAEIFNWIMGGVVVIITALSATIIVLYRSKATGLSNEEADMLKKVHNDLLPLITRLDAEQEGRRADIERLMGEQKEVFLKGLELTGKLPALMTDLKNLLEKVETLLRRQE